MVVEWDGGTLLQAEYADRHLVILMYVCVCHPRMPASCTVSGIVGSKSGDQCCVHGTWAE